MIYGINDGHCLTGKGTGAVGYKNETDMNRLVGKRLRTMLKESGHSAIDCTVDKSNNDLADIVTLANKQYLDLFISLHLNCFSDKNANGVETFSYAKSGKGHEYAVKIQNELVSSIGWKNRGKKEANFYVLRNTNASAVLIELGFCSNKEDMDKWDTEKICRAIFKAITGANYIPKQQTNSTTTSNVYRVFVDGKQRGTAYANHKNILGMVETALKNNATIIEVKKK
ncbi:N-acetylmuramoyl-L-alanine amidase [Clostridium massiliamazoniense]|uniref:N-acetylmuramoyl-L-alanine amidase n=1 Tax=Clostridium massiliamazoniense TaxID=1347366 RepID=UPI0006D839B5|nr:N-acetylmuramoyl-L-alanine amidase [Clostridium massiliamazoniense]